LSLKPDVYFHTKPVFINKGKVIAVHAMEAFAGVQVRLHLFLTSAVDGGEWLSSCPIYIMYGDRSSSAR